ncbi:phosphate ABC transporter ATP-binding protein [Desulforhopalus vacuolatus]|uniref:phosphate ABC transporter ATP-binding protein n=1 Tax=Desulforhopalus vacuolatus TaxID=40414 RepID=UPI0019652E8C|nr:phosphate ABC transporter ATP-binding protein [Desulforhopalus vacuolatus]MBM9519973.1 phosphate ABC transporter ATP-binding protein [Desulforhopalus vacuolatus]
MAAKIMVEQLSFSRGGRELLHDISMEVEENIVCAVTGSSGSGKTTFLALLNRLSEEEEGGVVCGRIRMVLDGKRVDIHRHLNPSMLRRKVAMVFQNPDPLPMSIRRNIAFPLRLRGWKKGQIAERTEEVLRMAHLYEEVKERLDTDARHLSGGQQQRLCIARALAGKPEILLLDEPTSSLDSKAACKIETLIEELGKDHTVILVSHHEAQIKRVASRVWRMEEGRLSVVE